MKYLLDTNICIGIMRDTLPKAVATLNRHDPSDICLCSIVLFELLFGVEICHRPEAELAKVHGFWTHFQSLDFDEDSAAEAASIRANLERRGLKIGPYDTQIAAIARQYSLTLVTRNLSEFQRVPHLRVEDWES